MTKSALQIARAGRQIVTITRSIPGVESRVTRETRVIKETRDLRAPKGIKVIRGLFTLYRR